MAPLPAGAPSWVCFIAGSSLAHGDQASHLWKSFTSAKTAGGGAEIFAARTTVNPAGWNATTTANTMSTAARPRRIFLSMVLGNELGGCRRSHAGAAREELRSLPPVGGNDGA